MILLLAIVVTGAVAACSLKLENVVLTVLAAYVALVAEVTLLTTVLSPFELVTRAGLSIGAAALLAVVLGIWWRRGRPGFGWRKARAGLAELVADRVVMTFVGLVVLVLAYELLLVLTVPPNNWDSLTYHLTRVAAWVQHHGVYWIPNAPTGRLNEFQPVAEQEILVLFVATGKGALFALPQLLAQIAIVGGIYSIAHSVGSARRASASAALLFPCLTLVALESTTAQNDLVAASFPVIAAALILRGHRVDLLLAGVAVGLGLGVKLTTAFVLPILLVLAIFGGRRALFRFGAASGVAFVALGMWGYVRNVAETGHVLGYGDGRVEHTADPSVVGTIATAYRTVYRLLDLSGYRTPLVVTLAFVSVVFLAGSFLLARRQHRPVRATVTGSTVGTVALLAPVVVLVAAFALHRFADLVNLPVDDKGSTSAEFSWNLGRLVTEDYSSFGPLGGVLILALMAGAAVQAIRGRLDRTRLTLALALPVFILLLAVTAKYNPWLSRFLVVPIALTMPLAAAFFRFRAAGIAILVAAAVGVGTTHWNNLLKPINGPEGQPWTLDQVEAVAHPFPTEVSVALRELDRRVPGATKLGALLDDDDPSYLVFGSQLKRRVTFLPVPNESEVLDREGINLVVIHSGDYGDPTARLRAKGWTFEDLGTFWKLASRP